MENNLLEAKILVKLPFVCLFWLSDDYNTITETNGKIEFTNLDILNKVSIEPKGTHGDFRLNPYLYNRGKVSIVCGKIEVTTGKQCTNEAIENIKQNFGLEEFSVQVIRTGLYDKC